MASLIPSKHATMILTLWADHETAGAIARKLGITRSAVLGFICRARRRGEPVESRPRTGPRTPNPATPPPTARPAAPAKRTVLSARPAAPSRPSPQPKPAASSAKPAPVQVPPPPAPPAIGAPAAVLALTQDCCGWPIGEPAAPDFRFCAAPVAYPGALGTRGRYCAEHWARSRPDTPPRRPRNVAWVF